MCEPTTIVAAVTAISAVANYQAQKQMRKDAEQSAVVANQQAQEAYTAQVQQIDDSADDQASQRAREAAIERGRLRAAAAETGLASSNGLDQLYRQSLFNEGADIASIENNRKASVEQAGRDLRSSQAGTQSRLNSVRKPSLLGTGLQIAGAYAGMQAEDQKLKAIKAGGSRGTTAPLA